METIFFHSFRNYAYYSWVNRLEKVEVLPCEEGTKLFVELRPRKSLIILFDELGEEYLSEPLKLEGIELMIQENWTSSICRSIDYPNFKEAKNIILPDNLAEEKPDFSGLVRYENTIELNGT
ncbi:hypothetical protein [Robertmurraya sp. P23]|uniref:hypothetical protein n=1 Tax=Robertmurraya sp. P23 TaxID=3436931 RepID=UPI003D978727